MDNPVADCVVSATTAYVATVVPPTGVTVPAVNVAVVPVRGTLRELVTVPAENVAVDPVRATVNSSAGVTVPAVNVPVLPVSATLRLGATLPAVNVAVLPVMATVLPNRCYSPGTKCPCTSSNTNR